MSRHGGGPISDEPQTMAEQPTVLPWDNDAEETAASPQPDSRVALGGAVGRYRLLSLLGNGGMGTVYRAHDPRLDREVALKLVQPGWLESPTARKRFDREARTLAALRHEGIVSVFDYSGLEAEPIYFVTELVDGPNLAQLAKAAGGRLPPLAIALVMHEVAVALDVAHREGLVHRDVKPANVLLDRAGRVVLADFGIARPAPAALAGAAGQPPESQTASLSFAGTPGFMSPEHAKGLGCDARSDIWSLGATAYEAVIGHAPFTGRNTYERMSRVIEGEYELAAPQLFALPGLGAIIDRCLANDPIHRPETAAVLVSLLDELLATIYVGKTLRPRTQLVALLGELLRRTASKNEVLNFAQAQPNNGVETKSLGRPPTDRPKSGPQNGESGLYSNPQNDPWGAPDPNSLVSFSTTVKTRKAKSHPAAIAAVAVGIGALATLLAIGASGGEGEKKIKEAAIVEPMVQSTVADAAIVATAVVDGSTVDIRPSTVDKSTVGKSAVDKSTVGKSAVDKSTVGKSLPPSHPSDAVMEPTLTDPPSAPQTAQPETGLLQIRSSHWFDVEINGRRLYRHPKRSPPIPIGSYSVRLVAPDCETVTARVEIKGGETSFVDGTCVVPAVKAPGQTP